MLSLYNTLTQQKEPFIPYSPGQVGLYVCGMTVYDYCHIGHARVWVVFDILTRYLRDSGLQVNYVRNITDIDDKIIQRAKETTQTVAALTQKMITAMHADMEALSILTPSYEPRATAYIQTMISFIKILIEKGYAYLASSGDVYYDISRFPTYGQLSHQPLKDLMSGARVAPDPEKKHPLDFILWKKRLKSQEPTWDSPWGLGRPGWHIECSAMAIQHLTPSFDIHGGGADLRFPHHQNEIAQSEAVTGQPLAKYWMHVGFVTINDEKMSKSKGNALTLRTLLSRYSGEVIRYFLLSSHYRSPINWSHIPLQAAEAALKKLYGTLLRNHQDVPDTASPEAILAVADYEERFRAAMEEDLNTPLALSVLFDLVRFIHRPDLKTSPLLLAGVVQLKKLGGLLGLLQQSPSQFLMKDIQEEELQWIAEHIEKRRIARLNKHWDIADQIRAQILQKGIVLEDSTEGTHWRLE